MQVWDWTIGIAWVHGTMCLSNLQFAIKATAVISWEIKFQLIGQTWNTNPSVHDCNKPEIAKDILDIMAGLSCVLLQQDLVIIALNISLKVLEIHMIIMIWCWFSHIYFFTCFHHHDFSSRHCWAELTHWYPFSCITTQTPSWFGWIWKRCMLLTSIM